MSMKLAEPSPAENQVSQVRFEEHAEPADVTSRRRFEMGVIGVLVLLCSIVLVSMTLDSTTPTESAMEEPGARTVRAAAPATFQEEVTRVVRSFVRHFDGSSEGQERLRGMDMAKLRDVVAGPNQTVLLRRGNLLHALYLLGENGYVIISGNEAKLVRLDDLRVTEKDASAPVTR